MELEQLIKLIQTVSDSALTGFQYEAEGIRLSLKKDSPKEICYAVQQEGGAYSGYTAPISPVPVHTAVPSGAADTTASEPAPAAQKEGKLITSMLVGTFYAAPAEDAEPFVKTGDRVKKGQTMGIIEAMKLMNEVESEYDGRIAEILVKNGEAVEYGQPLFRIVE